MKKILVTINKNEDIQTATNIGGEILAEYPSALLMRCNENQQSAMEAQGLEINTLDEPEIEITGHRFNFASAMKAEAISPALLDSGRIAYYLVKLIGPIKEEWLEEIRAQGGVVQANMPGFTLLVGLLPERISNLEQQDWIEAITPYRPSMKISSKLTQGPRSSPSAAELAINTVVDEDQKNAVQVEINVFEGENINVVEQEVVDAGGMILSKGSTSVTATVSHRTINDLANNQEVQSIVPYNFPKLHNDRARQIMGIQEDNSFDGTILTGLNQIVAVCDSGLDNGDEGNIHLDFRGRVVGIHSFPVPLEFSRYVNDPPGHNDGPADTGSAHGTHVAGSVLGSGTAAMQSGSNFVPKGVAPDAKVYFQATEQTINWKSAGQLRAEGIIVPPDWPPESTGLYGLPNNLETLFIQAYEAGARIHTNSWGADDAGVYNNNSKVVDEFVWTHPDFLILFSAGNSGKDLDTNGVIDADSIGSPATSKNCLTVGASENERPANSDPSPGLNANWNQLTRRDGSLSFPRLEAAGHISDNPEGLAAFSSRGPTDDGRIKPDIVAPGTNILSTRSSAYIKGKPPLWGDLPDGHPLKGLYCWSGGTSMSTPLVAGAAAIVRQWLIENYIYQDGVHPSAALLKALLINGAIEMKGQFAGEVPRKQNFVNGFGRLNLKNIIQQLESNQVVFFDDPEQAITTQQMRTFEVRPIDVLKPIKVTLIWTDAPSQANIGGLQNKLYLQVRQPSGSVINGDTAPFPNSINNVQQIDFLSLNSNETYEIRIRGISIIKNSPRAALANRPGQDFALVVSNASSSHIVA